MQPKYSSLKTPISGLKLALMEVTSKKPGPTIWLTGAAHGDEVGGIIIIHEIFKRLKKYPLLKGSLKALPLLNPIGFENVTRRIPYGQEPFDLNRSFPGKPKGNMAQKLAHTIFATITSAKPDLVLDLHNDWINSIPHTLLDPLINSKNKNTFIQNKKFALKLGLPILLEAKEKKLQQSLSASLIKQQIPALTVEIGGASPVSSIAKKKDVEDGVKAIWDLLSSLGMVKPVKQKFNCQIPQNYKNKILNYTFTPKAGKKGVVVYLAKPGLALKKGQALAEVYNVYGKLEQTLRTPQNGLFIGHADYSVASPGAEIISLGIL